METIHQPIEVYTENGLDRPISKDFSCRLDHYGFLLVKKGMLKLSVNLNEYTIADNTVVFLGPNATYGCVDISQEHTVSCVRFSADYILQKGYTLGTKEMMELFVVGNEPFLKIGEASANDLFMLFNLLQSKQRPIAGDELAFGKAMDHLFELIMLELAPEYQRQRSSVHLPYNRKEHLAMRFLEEVGLHFKEERAVKYYASQLHINEKHLSRIIKEQSGKTAGEIIDDAVIMESKILLRNLHNSIAEIADILHFSNQSFFGKYFKKHTGYSPSEYRQVGIAA